MADSASSTTDGLIVDGISKSYEGSWALRDVSLSVRPGSVVALVGHNGAGKSTLLRSLSGAERPDTGQILIDGVPQSFGSPADAAAAGIACVYQELSLIDGLTVAQNLFLGQEQLSGGLLKRGEMNRIADELCQRFGIRARAGDVVASLPVAQRQMIEVARAVNRGSRFLLLDEPTTALEQEQIDHLLDIVRQLAREQQLGVMLVDHKLDEVFAVADHIVGLSNGRRVLDGDAADVSHEAVVSAVVGEDMAEDILAAEQHTSTVINEPGEPGPAVLVADHVSGPRLTDVSLDVAEGEVLGIYGLVGAGRTRFVRSVFGAEPIDGGSLTLGGRPYSPRNPRAAIRAGVALVSEERKFDGFVPMMNSRDNAVLPILDRFRTAGLLNWRRLHESADEALSRITIRGDVSGPISGLSGGNQQKALFARATLQAPRLLLLDEPTKGVDIGAKAEIYQIIRGLARDKHVAIIVVSSEEEELFAVADRVVVFRLGSCDGESYTPAELTAAKLRELAWTGESQTASAK